MSCVKISVRALVESVLGSVARSGGPVSLAAKGRDAHTAVQASRPEGYLAEERIEGGMVVGGQKVILTGRLDGLFWEESMWVVEEIKLATASQVTHEGAVKDRPEYWAQLTVYCWLVAMDRDVDMVLGRLTRATPEGDIVREEDREFTREEAEDFTRHLLEQYLGALKAGEKWKLVRDASIRDMGFPFAEPRQGQMELAMEVLAACREEGKLLAEAPTGLGKTMGVLFPAVASLAEGTADRVFYLTAKTTGKAAAEQALDMMRSRGARIRSTTLTARDRICPRGAGECAPAMCMLFHGYMRHGRVAVSEGLSHDAYTRQFIENLAGEHGVCPFELGLDLSTHSDVIIGDYNHALDPRARLIRFFEKEKGPKVLLFDEAHNLVERSRAIFSARLDKQGLPGLARTLKPPWPDTAAAVEELNAWFLETFRGLDTPRGGFVAEREGPLELADMLEDIVREAMAGPLVEERHPDENLLALYYEARAFLGVLESYGEGHATLYHGSGANAAVELACLDPSDSLAQALDMQGAAVFFSATLGPAMYYRRMFAFDQTDADISLDSPFPRENLGLVAMGISTLYRDRERTAGQVADSLLAMYDTRPGNYLFFFPSYQYLKLVLSHFQYRGPYVRTLVQEQHMGEGARDRFLAAFSTEDSSGLAGFAVMGGAFGEGVDLVGERLHGAAIVGVGLPPVSQRLDLIRRHYEEKDEPGYRFVYTYPGLAKVLQAAGRVIRTEEDRGVILLVDQRWGRREYRELMPGHWRPRFASGVEELGDILREFWD